jgi:dipeptidyl aminopeptidase/acylaminoacyl peptidase
MQMFLALERYPELQHHIKKIASISGLLNVARAIENRSDFKEVMIRDFGLTEDSAGKDWIAKRQPIHGIATLSKKLPMMIAQGTADTRVCLQEGYDMLQALHDAGHKVTYVEIEGGDHVLQNSPDFTRILMNWLEQPDDVMSE